MQNNVDQRNFLIYIYFNNIKKIAHKIYIVPKKMNRAYNWEASYIWDDTIITDYI